MDRLRETITSRERGAALLIVLAFVVLLTGVGVAYLSRTTSDRQVAHGSFNQSKADQLAASAMDNIIGDLRKEIANGSTLATISGVTIYTPALPAYSLPQRYGNPAGVPNLIRRSVANDQIPLPGLRSFASDVNSAPVDPANPNRGDVTKARWNKHYLIPKANIADDGTDPVASFAAPDWVFVTSDPANRDAGRKVITSPDSSVIGRYAYAIYDEGGLLDINVAGNPTDPSAAPIPAQRVGRKGSLAYADLTALSNYPILNPDAGGIFQIDRLVGWRNYATTQPTNKFPDAGPTGQVFARNFQTDATKATAYYNSVVNNANGFLGPNPTAIPWNGRTDQYFVQRQELIAYQKTPLTTAGNPAVPIANTSQFDVNALQYLSTFSRELNAPSWGPTLNASEMGGDDQGGLYAYRNNADSTTAINRNLLGVRVLNSFIRADGTTAAAGDPLINRRFPLSRLIAITPTGPNTTTNSTIIRGVFQPATTTSDNNYPELPAGGTIQRDFGLQWDNTNKRWNYVGGSGSIVQTTIERLDQVANENREPNFFELLKAAILSGSVGMGSGTGNARTFVAPEGKYYDTTNNMSSDYQIMQIGANIINQRDSGNVPLFFNFYDNTGNYELAGTKNLPYLSKLVFKPAWVRVQGNDQFAAWLVPSLWNPHQNAASATGNVRVAMTSGTMTAPLKNSGNPSSITTTTPIVGSSTQYMTVDASNFGTSPSAPALANPANGSNITQMDANLGGYYGFHFPFATTSGVGPNNSTTAYPDFGSGCTFEMQVTVGGTWKAYQRWKACGLNHPLIFQPPNSYWTDNTKNKRFEDPEFVTLDPRTQRFGVWGNAYNQSLNSADVTAGTQTSLDSPPVEAVTAFPPQGTLFSRSPPTSTDLYLYANNTDSGVHYTDLDQVQRLGDVTSPTVPDEMQLTASAARDRPLILAGVLQSVAELGHVFRDQPWKTLNFTTANPNATVKSADAGLLDVFTLHESSIEAGKTSLNMSQTPVLKAILAGAIKRLAGTSGDIISSADRDNIVTALTNLTNNQPMLNKAELITRLAADVSVTGLGNKEARECVLRAFADACQTRTWNLMIDVIAQSGHYPPNANSLAGFMVEGEQHYWVHVAIDRFTGQVIDKQIEVVNE